ncbi:molecular chaperone [Photobacterium ganghwense]|uniref:Chaperone n=1 Tax=Photobacterium ganghwense TaxID=320778 RepID=A0A0J1K4T4_9GAMM|nr:molecular chaperone [Photobacterium ganghwense]KLV09397.1 chaperone [Photobacterium ganghwense]MBV1839472.1 molecular chaperone [Photobacterium ganghwense]PSU08548.1 molecular chaperone [Photobacterium ganghwense]QSV15355.1 molecular chaperone [Photobacterium ganghwense]
MFIGFDYGTANCSVAVMENGQPTLLPLEGENTFIPSTLCAPTREAVSEYLYRFMGISPADSIGEQVLRRAINMNRDEDIEVEKGDLLFGQAALDLYLADPEEVYYVKSPKSFLGANGLQDVQISFFEDLVCAMMANIKSQAERSLSASIDSTMIGRPINFQGTGGEKANQQAETILRRAAERAGFKHIAFQFEPVAAGLEYESTLNEDKTVLVVDIGGGTTDCSMIQMGPSWAGKTERQSSLLAHSGLRVGGNDLDIYLAFRQIMPLLGMGSQTKKGIDMPVSQFWNPIAINNVVAQSDFYGSANFKTLDQLRRDAAEPEKLAKLIRVYHETLGYQLVRNAEECKIALSEQALNRIDLGYLSDQLHVDVSQHELASAIEAPKAHISKLVEEAMVQSGVTPDVVYMTGGTARSPVLRQCIEQLLPGTPVVSGSYFGSVTAGLARWAEHCFR